MLFGWHERLVFVGGTAPIYAGQSPKDWENNSIIIVMIGWREKKETAIDRTMDDSPERDE